MIYREDSDTTHHDFAVVCSKIYGIVVVKNVVHVFPLQNHGWGENKLVHLVERILLYRTVYVSYLVHSNFIREFFEYLLVLVVNKVSQKVSEFFVVSRYSDAAFHEESEYAIGFEIRKNICRDFSIFLRKSYQNFSKLKRRRQQNFAFISMNIGVTLKTFLPKCSAKDALQTLKVAANSDEVTGLTGDFIWTHPYPICFLT